MTDCIVCSAAEPCDMHCSMCRAELFDPMVETFTLTRWAPPGEHDPGHNELIGVICGACWVLLPLP